MQVQGDEPPIDPDTIDATIRPVIEQLRALENGYTVAVVDTEYECIGVDTPEDLSRVSALLEAGPRRTACNALECVGVER